MNYCYLDLLQSSHFFLSRSVVIFQIFCGHFVFLVGGGSFFILYRYVTSVTEMSTRNISWRVKAADAWGWQPYHLHVLIVLKSGNLNLLGPSGSAQACNGIALPLHYVCICITVGEPRCATNRKIAGSIPFDVIGFFNWHKILPIALRSWGRLSL